MHRISRVAPVRSWPAQDALIRDFTGRPECCHCRAAEKNDEQKQRRDRVEGQTQRQSRKADGKREPGRSRIRQQWRQAKQRSQGAQASGGKPDDHARQPTTESAEQEEGGGVGGHEQEDRIGHRR